MLKMSFFAHVGATACMKTTPPAAATRRAKFYKKFSEFLPSAAALWFVTAELRSEAGVLSIGHGTQNGS
jgi:hypothetical protein